MLRGLDLGPSVLATVQNLMGCMSQLTALGYPALNRSWSRQSLEVPANIKYSVISVKISELFFQLSAPTPLCMLKIAPALSC